MREFIAAGFLSVALAVLPAAAQTPPSAQRFADLGDFKLVSGQSIHACELGYRTLGNLNAAKSNAILFPTAFTMQSDTAVSFFDQKHPLFDPSRYFVIVVDALGDGISCSPSTSSSQSGAAFPSITIEDMVASEHALMAALGISHLHAVVGVSMGGMQAFQWAVQYPEFMDEVVPIVGSPQPTSYDLLVYNEELAALPNMTAVRLIHAAIVSTPEYRIKRTSRAEFAKFYKDAIAPNGSSFDSDDWRAQLEAVIAHDITHGGTLSEAAARVRAPMLIVASQQDHAVNPAPALEFAHLVHAKTFVLNGDCGHVAFYCQVDDVRPILDAFLKGSPSR